MKFLMIAVTALAGLGFTPTVSAAPSMPLMTGDAAVVFHGGGCRKDSPRGRCCHAGSKPYHCH